MNADLRPLMHNIVFKENERDAVFLPFRVTREDLAAFIEDFRHTSLTAAACTGALTGFGPAGYHMAVRHLVGTGA